MWSKQTETRNKNMTSLKSKISHRKRKNSGGKSANGNLAQTIGQPENEGKNAPPGGGGGGGGGKNVRSDSFTRKNNKQQQQQNGTLRKNGGVKNEVKSDRRDANKLGEDVAANGTPPIKAVLGDSVDGTASVSLKFPPYAPVQIGNQNQHAKRYSDSFVLDLNSSRLSSKTKVQQSCIEENASPLSRAHSGYLVTNADDSAVKPSEKEAIKKTRRFSDLFKPSHHHNHHNSSKSATENVPIVTVRMPSYDEDFGDVELRRKDLVLTNGGAKSDDYRENTVMGKPVQRRDSNRDSRSKSKKVLVTADKSEQKKNVKVNEDKDISYLKRVKSKIYKNRTENANAVNKMPDISEDTNEKKRKSKNKEGSLKDLKNLTKDFSNAAGTLPLEMRKSVSTQNFDFRLIRQTSNLERIRSKTFGIGLMPLRPASSNVGISELIDSDANILNSTTTQEKPSLFKSKSSNAINLNLLRMRWNNLM